jgi:hypothetical protein
MSGEMSPPPGSHIRQGVDHPPHRKSAEHPPRITFREFRKVATRQEWSLEWLVEYCKSELDRPTDTVRCLLEGARVEGHREGRTWVAPHWDDMADVVLPYRCLIELYRRATRGRPALPGERACLCGCGGRLRGKQQFASPACRQRKSRIMSGKISWRTSRSQRWGASCERARKGQVGARKVS